MHPGVRLCANALAALLVGAAVWACGAGDEVPWLAAWLALFGLVVAQWKWL